MVTNPHTGKLIQFEGIDASGKSTAYLRFKNHTLAYNPELAAISLFTKEPNVEHESGKEIYDILLNRHPTLKMGEMHPFEIQSHYFRNRVWHYQHRVLPALANATHVFSDRGLASMCFGVSSPNEFGPLLAIEEQFFLASDVPFVWPDMILIYDVGADVARERLSASGKELDEFEKSLEIQMRTRDNYLEFAKRYSNCHVIDGSGKPEDVFLKTKEAISQTLGLLK